MSKHKFHGDIRVDGVVELPALSGGKALISNVGKEIVESVVTSGELAFVSGVTSSIQDQLNAKQADVITTQGDLIVGDGSGDASRLALGTEAQVLAVSGSTAVWKTVVTSDELVKVSSDDTTGGYLEAKLVGATGDGIISETLNPGGNEQISVKLSIPTMTAKAAAVGADLIALSDSEAAGANKKIEVVDLSPGIDHDALANFVSNEHVDHTSVSITGVNGLTGGGDISGNRSIGLDINGQSSASNLLGSDELMVYQASDGLNHKVSVAALTNKVAGDLSELSFSLADSQAAPADVTGLAFANGSVRSFKAEVSVFIDATSDLFETFTLMGVQKGSSWDMAVESVGDDSLIEFSITSAGQVKYTSDTYAGFSSGVLKARATVTSV